METKLLKQDQQAAVGDTVYGTPDHYMQLNSTNAIDLGTSSDENSQFEFTGQCLFGEWLMQGDNYPLVSLCQGIVDVAYQQPRRMRQVGYWQSSSCMLWRVGVYDQYMHVIVMSWNTSVHLAPSEVQFRKFCCTGRGLYGGENLGTKLDIIICTLYRSIQQQSGTIQQKKSAAYNVRRTRLYHNCKLLAPDGQLLSTIDKRKLEWYLQKGLGSKYWFTLYT